MQLLQRAVEARCEGAGPGCLWKLHQAGAEPPGIVGPVGGELWARFDEKLGHPHAEKLSASAQATDRHRPFAVEDAFFKRSQVIGRVPGDRPDSLAAKSQLEPAFLHERPVDR